MKRLLTFLVIATLILSGCTHKQPATESQPTLIPESTVSTIPAATQEEETIPDETETLSQPVISSTPTTKSEDVQDDRTFTEKNFNNTEPTEKKSESHDSRPIETTPVSVPTEEKPKETAPPATTEPVRETENTSPTEAPTQAPSPTEEESPIPSQPVEETQPEPEFEISYWITFAKDYAKSLGLNLDAAAVDCWDNPITAGSHCIYLERDIKNRLNRYNKDEDITDVWIWAVDLGNGSYDLYIGYA